MTRQLAATYHMCDRPGCAEYAETMMGCISHAIALKKPTWQKFDLHYPGPRAYWDTDEHRSVVEKGSYVVYVKDLRDMHGNPLNDVGKAFSVTVSNAITLPVNWLQVLDTAERAQVDHRVPQQLHAIVPLLEAFKAE